MAGVNFYNLTLFVEFIPITKEHRKFPDEKMRSVLFSQLHYWHCTYEPCDIRLTFCDQPVKQETGKML